MANVFMSYRRDDSPGTTGRLYDWLVRKYRKEHVFKDVYSVPGGSDFRTYIATVLQKSDVFLVIIGPHWLDSITADGQYRLDDPDDFVRIEIEVAFINEIPVIPVLVEGATPLKEDQLPAPLKRLAHLQALPMRNDPDFPVDRDKLITTINETIAQLKRPHLPGQRKPATETARLAAEYVEAATNDALNTGKYASHQQARVRRYTLASAALTLVALVAIVLLIVTKLGPSGPQVNSPATIAASVRGTVTANAGEVATFAAQLATASPSLARLDTKPIVVILNVDANGLLADDSSAAASVVSAISHNNQLKGRRAGLVETYGGTPDQAGTGTAFQVAGKVDAVLQTLGGPGQIFEGTTYHDPLFTLGQSYNYVKLEIYPFKIS